MRAEKAALRWDLSRPASRLHSLLAPPHGGTLVAWRQNGWHAAWERVCLTQDHFADRFAHSLLQAQMCPRLRQPCVSVQFAVMPPSCWSGRDGLLDVARRGGQRDAERLVVVMVSGYVVAWPLNDARGDQKRSHNGYKSGHRRAVVFCIVGSVWYPSLYIFQEK